MESRCCPGQQEGGVASGEQGSEEPELGGGRCLAPRVQPSPVGRPLLAAADSACRSTQIPPPGASHLPPTQAAPKRE